MGLSKKTRFAVFKRDGFVCRYCGKRPPDTVLEVDHIVPLSVGGTDDPENLVTACFACNRGKAAEPLGEGKLPHVDESEIMAATQEIMEKKLALEASLSASISARESEEEALGVVLEWWTAETGKPDYCLDRASVLRFIRDLPLERVREAIGSTALARPGGMRRTSRYFYKVCWNMIREQESEA